MLYLQSTLFVCRYKPSVFADVCCVFEILPSPISTRLVVPLALPSTRLKVNVPSSVTSRESINSSIRPLDLSNFIVYFCRQGSTQMHIFQYKCSLEQNICIYCSIYAHLSLLNDDIIENILHLAGRSEFLHLSPEPHTAFLKQLHGHFILEGNN